MPRFALGLFFLVAAWGLAKGAVQIPQCSAQGWLEIREENQQSPPDVTCTGLPLNDFKWQLGSHSAVTVTINCIGGTCLSRTDDVRVTGISTGDRTSELYIDSNHRSLFGNGTVKCLPSSGSAPSCKTNVINPAVLSDCEVTMTAHRTLAGTCNFRKAYSSNGTYTCTWTLKPLGRQGDPDVIIPGDINKTEYTQFSKQYYRGTCSFSGPRLPAGNYSYTVLLFPGSQYQGTKTVTLKLTDPAVLSDCEVTMSARRTLTGTCNFHNAYSSNGSYACTWTLTLLDVQEDTDVIIPGVIHKTSYTLSGKQYYNGTCSLTRSGLPVGNYSYNVRFFPGSQYQGTINVTYTEPDASQAHNKDGDDTDGAVSGGVIAAVVITFVVIIVAVIVVVVVMRRRRRANAEEAFVDFDNPAYVSAEREVTNASPHQQQPKPPAAAYNVPSNNCSSPPTGRPTPSQATALTTTNTGPDYYNLHDDEDDALDLGYSSVSFGRGTRPAPGGGERGTGVSTSDNDAPPRPVAEEDEGPELCDAHGVGHGSGDDVGGGGDVYAQVDKSSKRRGPQSPASDDNHGDDGVGDLYTQVDKSSKRHGPQSPAFGDNGDDDVYANEGVGDAYAQVDKNARGRKP